MAASKNAVVQYRRKRTGYTDYKVRLALLKSRKPRLVVRKTMQYILAQLVEYSPAGDKVLLAVSSKELDKQGWKFSKNSVPAAYLTGLLLGKKAQVKEAIVDLGSNVSKKESKLYAVVKGAIDAGMTIPVSEEVIPSEDRLSGKHIAAHASKLSKEEYNKQYSGYAKKKLSPEKMPEAFEKVKKAIM
jgi:large subunit ribosomal protein L18